MVHNERNLALAARRYGDRDVCVYLLDQCTFSRCHMEKYVRCADTSERRIDYS